MTLSGGGPGGSRMSCLGASVFLTLGLACKLLGVREGCEENYRTEHSVGWKEPVFLLNSSNSIEIKFNLAFLGRDYCSFIKILPQSARMNPELC